MEGIKKWWASNGAWASIVQIIVGIAASLGLVTTEAGQEIMNEAPVLIVTLVQTIAGIWGLIGRLRAKKAIAK